jgi:hypothetical protein
MVKPVVVYRSEKWPMTHGYEKTEHVGEENSEEDVYGPVVEQGM